MLGEWRNHVDVRQRDILSGREPYVDSDVIDAECARLLSRRQGGTGPEAIETLRTASHRLPPWGDAVAALGQIAAVVPTMVLSNSSDITLQALQAHSGLRWNRAVSGESVRAYKPDARLYRRAIDVAGCPPRNALMVAAHAWDLRAAQAAGMSTAYIARPVADPPTTHDRFDAAFSGLHELAIALWG